MNTILIFDYKLSGHHTEYIKHLVDRINDQKQNNTRYVFALSEKVKDFNNLHNDLLNNLSIKVDLIPEKLCQKLGEYGPFYRSFKAFFLVKKLIRKNKATSCILLDLNVFFASFSVPFISFPARVKGIYFKQHTRNTHSSFITKLRKILQICSVSRKNFMESIYILNDPASCKLLNKKFNFDKFKYLPDPVNFISRNNKQVYISDKVKKRYLLFGSISARKGIFELLKAVKIISNENRKKIHIDIVGKIHPSIEHQVIEMVDLLKKTVDINLVNSFVSFDELQYYFYNTDYILMPYTFNEASSGIIGHAMVFKKPVIGPESGLIGKQIKSLKLGYSINICPISLANAIQSTIKQNFSLNYVIIDRFLASHTPEFFAKIIFLE